MLEGLDGATVALLALLVAVDGGRRVPPGAVVLRKAPATPWRVLPLTTDRSRFRLLSWAAPFTLTLVLATAAETTPLPPGVDGLRGRVLALRALGGLTAACLVAGVPVASRWWGGRGFLLAAALTLTLAVATVVVTLIAARTLGAPADGIAWALPLLSPFAAARAGEIFLARVLAERSPLAVARELLHPQDFAAWVRPAVYDRLHGSDGGDSRLEAMLDPDAQRALVEARPVPREGATAFCPRCGMGFTDRAAPCPACHVPVVEY